MLEIDAPMLGAIGRSWRASPQSVCRVQCSEQHRFGWLSAYADQEHPFSSDGRGPCVAPEAMVRVNGIACWAIAMVLIAFTRGYRPAPSLARMSN